MYLNPNVSIIIYVLGVEGEHTGLVASHEEDGREVTAHGLQPAHVTLTRHASLGD